MRSWIVCVAVTWPLAALGAPKATPQSQYKAAAAQYGNGNYEQALALIATALEAAPKDVSLLRLRATVLLELRNYSEALGAYEALLEAGVRGADRLRAEEIVKKLRALTANVAYGVAGDAVIAAAVLWLTSAPERRPGTPGPRLAVTPRLGDVAGLDLAVRF